MCTCVPANLFVCMRVSCGVNNRIPTGMTTPDLFFLFLISAWMRTSCTNIAVELNICVDAHVVLQKELTTFRGAYGLCFMHLLVVSWLVLY